MYQHILVPIDGSETSKTAIQHAASIAQACQSKITLVQVLILDPLIAAEYLHMGESNHLIERARTVMQQDLSKAQQLLLEYGVNAESQILEGHVVHSEILNAATALQADLIIMGSHGYSGIKKLFLGSVAQNLISEASIPVLITGQSTPT